MNLEFFQGVYKRSLQYSLQTKELHCLTGGELAHAFDIIITC